MTCVLPPLNKTSHEPSSARKSGHAVKAVLRTMRIATQTTTEHLVFVPLSVQVAGLDWNPTQPVKIIYRCTAKKKKAAENSPFLWFRLVLINSSRRPSLFFLCWKGLIASRLGTTCDSWGHMISYNTLTSSHPLEKDYTYKNLYRYRCQVFFQGSHRQITQHRTMRNHVVSNQSNQSHTQYPRVIARYKLRRVQQ